MKSDNFRPVVIVDLETGGLDPSKDAILEVAACRYFPTHKGLKPDYWHKYYLPNGRVTKGALRINDLTVSKLRANGADSSFDGDIEKFLDWCAEPFDGEKILWAGHNVHFDVSFLRCCAARNGVAFPGSYNAYVDSGSLFATFYLGCATKSLLTLADCAFKHRPTHGAMDDVFACREAINMFMNTLELAPEGHGLPE